MYFEIVFFNGIDDICVEGLILLGVKEDGMLNDIVVDLQVYYQIYWNCVVLNVFEVSFIKLCDVCFGYKIFNCLFGKVLFCDVIVFIFGCNLVIFIVDLLYFDLQIIIGVGNDQGLENVQIFFIWFMGVNLSFKF